MGISNTTIILLESFMVALSQIPILFADTHQGYKQESFVDMIDPKITVKIQNIMGGSAERISVHCKSKKDDLGLGTHILRPKESVQWRFPPSKFLNTPFNCNVTWGKHSVSFDAYDFLRDSGKFNRCMQCVWRVSKDSIVGEGLWPYPDLIIKWPKI